jgi:hypothetical protein
MSRPLLLRPASKISFKVVTVAACALLALPALAASQARIVRLSDVQGTVQIDKNIGLGFENAFLNLPITQGTQLRTRDNGRAEIEFEDGSCLRLAPNTTVEFAALGVNDSGQRVSQIGIVEGMAYVNWLGKDQVSIDFSQEKVIVDHAAHFRLDASAQKAHLAVFKGDVAVDGPAGKVEVARNKTATFDVSDNDKSTLASTVSESPLDSWDRNASEYHDQYAKNVPASPYGYGLSDLNYYGSYTDVPGYGSMWQPYFTGVGWNPFMDGAWGWYPGYGYMFASAYPWGWLPYRYGNWTYVPAYGWMWQPGGWNSWQGVPRYTNTTLVHVNPLVIPATGTKTVVVGKGGAVSAASPSRLVVNAGSGGFGIPRGSLDSLSHLNRQVAKSGFAEVRPVQFSATAERENFFGGVNAPSALSSASSEHSSSSSSGHSSGGSSGGHH